jgi:hypothetical protein
MKGIECFVRFLAVYGAFRIIFTWFVVLDKTYIMRDIDDCAILQQKMNGSRTLPTTTLSTPCFLTVLVAANGNFTEAIQNVGELGIRLPGYRYIVVTNDNTLDTKDWEKVIVRLDKDQWPKVKAHVTYAKFLGWTLPELAQCRVIFYMDALNVPVDNVTIWMDLEERVNASPGGLLAQLKPHNRTVMELLKMLPGMQKETNEAAWRTIRWLEARSDFNNKTLCLWANFFGYNPSSSLYRMASMEFWSLYSHEGLTLRDQPLWSYIVEKHQLNPAYLPEFRPHISICGERDSLLCERGDTNITKKACEKANKQRRYPLVGLNDLTKIDCSMLKGGHTMSVLNSFETER